MFIDPKKVVFETKDDVIDYVSKGFFPPRESHFNELMNKVRNPDEKNDIALACKKGKEVVIDNTIIPEADRKVLEEVLSKVYENRVETRDTVLTLAGIGVAATVLYNFFSSKNDEEVDYFDALFLERKEKGTYTDKSGNTITIW